MERMKKKHTITFNFVRFYVTDTIKRACECMSQALVLLHRQHYDIKQPNHNENAI